MSLLRAAVVPSAPLLVPEVAGGSADADAPLRERVRSAVAELRDQPHVVVVGVAPRDGRYDGTWDWSGFGVARRGPGHGRGLPLALALGAWLLDDAGATGERLLYGVAEHSTPAACVRAGAELASDRDVALLVVGDGTARRTEKAPGHLDPRAERWDATAAQALRSGDPSSLLALDVGLGAALLASGRAPWQVLAGAAQGRTWHAELLHDEAPYGVAYLLATWQPA
jgi:hypothetical protein